MTDMLVTVIGLCMTTIAMGLIVSLSHRRLTATITAAIKGMQASVTIAGNGGGTTATRGLGGFGPLVWLPLWCQTGGLLPDGRLDPQQYSDCGETCAAMVIAACRGVSVHPGDIRQQLGGNERSGLTSGSDLVQALAMNNVHSHLVSVDADHGWGELIACYGLAKPAIALGYWLNMSSLHWMLLIDKATGVLTFVDPWTGMRTDRTAIQFKGQFYGSIVVVDDRCLYDVSEWDTPGTGSQA